MTLEVGHITDIAERDGKVIATCLACDWRREYLVAPPVDPLRALFNPMELAKSAAFVHRMIARMEGA